MSQKDRRRMGIPASVEPASVPGQRICPACNSVRDDSWFDEKQKHCKDCNEKKAREKAESQMRVLSGELLSPSAAGNLDGFIEELFRNLGGENAFAAMVADQIKTAFEKFPGRSSNVAQAIQFMKLLGMRDSNKLDRELKDLSYEELKLERAKVAKDVFLEMMTDHEKIVFAKQILNSTGEIVLPGIESDTDDSTASDDGAESEARAAS